MTVFNAFVKVLELATQSDSKLLTALSSSDIIQVADKNLVASVNKYNDNTLKYKEALTGFASYFG